MPSPRLADTRLPSGGTTNTGVIVPLSPVGLLACPVDLSMKAVPPISLLFDRRVIRMPAPPLPMRTLPPRFVPMRLDTTVLPDDPSSTTPFPPFPEITFATTPTAAARLSPIRFRDEPGAT